VTRAQRYYDDAICSLRAQAGDATATAGLVADTISKHRPAERWKQWTGAAQSLPHSIPAQPVVQCDLSGSGSAELERLPSCRAPLEGYRVERRSSHAHLLATARSAICTSTMSIEGQCANTRRTRIMHYLCVRNRTGALPSASPWAAAFSPGLLCQRVARNTWQHRRDDRSSDLATNARQLERDTRRARPGASLIRFDDLRSALVAHPLPMSSNRHPMTCQNPSRHVVAMCVR